MKYFFYLVTIFFLAVVNFSLFDLFPIKGQLPNLLFILAIIFALDKNNFDFFFIATASGILLDFYSANFFGGFTLGFLMSVLFIYLLSENFIFLDLSWKYLFLILVSALAVLNLTIWFYGFMAFKFGWTASHIELSRYINAFFPALFYNWLLVYPVYIFTNWLKDLIETFTIRSRGVVR